MLELDSKIEISEEMFNRFNQHTMNGFDGLVSETIFKIIAQYRDQRVYYVVNKKSFMPDIEKKMYAEYGVYFMDSSLVRDIGNRKYLLIVESHVSKENLEEYCRSFIENNLPEGATPTSFVVDTELRTFDEVSKWNNAMQSLFPDIRPLASYSDLKKEVRSVESTRSIIEDAERRGYEIIDVRKELEELEQIVKTNNYASMKEFQRITTELGKRVKKNSLLFSSEENKKYIGILSAFMFYEYKLPAHLMGWDNGAYLTEVSNLLFNRRRMLVEDQITYIRELPDLMLKLSENLAYMVLLHKDSLSCELDISYVKVEGIEDSPVERMKISIDDLLAIPLLDEVNLDSSNPKVVSAEHDRLLKMFVIAEGKMPNVETVMDVTNSFFMEYKEEKYLAYINSIELKLPAHLIPLRPDMKSAEYVFDISDLSALYPVNILPGYEQYTARTIAFVKTRYNKVIKKLDVYKTKAIYGPALKELGYFGTERTNWKEVVDFVTAGLWWTETYVYRSALNRQLLEHVKLKETRKANRFLSVFGGPHPSFSDQLLLTEKTVRGGF